MTRKCNLQFIIKVVIWEIEPRYGTEFNEVTLDKANKVMVKTLLPQPLIEKKFLTWNEMCNCNRQKNTILTLCLLKATCCLLITFANSLDPDQERHNVYHDLDWIPNCLTLRYCSHDHFELIKPIIINFGFWYLLVSEIQTNYECLL